MPQACSVNMSYQVMHEKVPSRDYNFYGGPAGGLSQGVANLEKADYSRGVRLDTSDELGEIAGRGRYLPTGHVAGYDDQSFLDRVDNNPINSGRHLVDIVEDARDVYTGENSATDG